jgi:hypothetical protein
LPSGGACVPNGFGAPPPRGVKGASSQRHRQLFKIESKALSHSRNRRSLPLRGPCVCTLTRSVNVSRRISAVALSKDALGSPNESLSVERCAGTPSTSTSCSEWFGLRERGLCLTFEMAPRPTRAPSCPMTKPARWPHRPRRCRISISRSCRSSRRDPSRVFAR